MTSSRVSGSLNRRWPPTPHDRQDDAVAEVCGYIAAGSLTPAQRQALSLALAASSMAEWVRAVVPVQAVGGAALPELPGGAVGRWSWGRDGGIGR